MKYRKPSSSMRTVVARIDGEFGNDEARFAAGRAGRQRLVALGGLLAVVPVAHADERAAVHEFAGLVRRARRAVFAQDENFGVRDRLADRVGSAIDFGRRQVGRAERLGQAVHQVGLGFRQARAQRVEGLARHATAGVGEVAQVLGDARRPLELRQLDVQRRHGGEARHALALQRVDHVARQQVIEQDDARAGVKSRRQLAEAGVEGKRQRGEQRVLGIVFEVARDALCAGDHVAVREHDAFRVAGAARGVKDRRHVGVDHAMAGARRRADDVAPALQACAAGRRRQGVGVDEDHVAQVGRVRERLGEKGVALLRGDEHAHVAVAQDVANLLRLEEWVDRHEDRAGARRAEARDDRFEAFLEIYGDALAARNAEIDHAAGKTGDGGLQRRIVERLLAEAQCR